MPIRKEDETVGQQKMTIVSCVVTENVNDLSRSTFDICVRIGKDGEPFRLRSFLGKLPLALQLDGSIFPEGNRLSAVQEREVLNRMRVRFVAGAVITASINYVPSGFRGRDFKPSDRILENGEIVSVQIPRGLLS